MEKDSGITQRVGANLAELLSDKIFEVYRDFPKQRYVQAIASEGKHLRYSQRIELHADELRRALPENFKEAVWVLLGILGDENANETGMFTRFYWILPIGKFVEKYGLDHYDVSMHAIEEITKRNTGEYAIRPFIRAYPEKTLAKMKTWARSDNFHLRRLASEGLRPKLPWATKLDTFLDNPAPVFEVLEMLKEDEVTFVKKSVANHLTDWLKVNKPAALGLIRSWRNSNNRHTQWILKRATRKFDFE